MRRHLHLRCMVMMLSWPVSVRYETNEGQGRTTDGCSQFSRVGKLAGRQKIWRARSNTTYTLHYVPKYTQLSTLMWWENEYLHLLPPACVQSTALASSSHSYSPSPLTALIAVSHEIRNLPLYWRYSSKRHRFRNSVKNILPSVRSALGPPSQL